MSRSGTMSGRRSISHSAVEKCARCVHSSLGSVPAQKPVAIRSISSSVIPFAPKKEKPRRSGRGFHLTPHRRAYSTPLYPSAACFSAASRSSSARLFFSLADFNCPQARSEEHTSELQSLMRISYAVFCLKKKKNNIKLDKHKSYTGL